MSRIPGWAALRSRWSAVTSRWRAAVALLMVFAAGAAGGVLLEDVVDAMDWPEFEARGHDDDLDDSEETILANMDLTAEQRASVERLFEEREDRLETYWDAQLPELEQLVDSSREEIRSLLTPEQRTIYDTHVSRLRAHLRRELREDHDD
jgi:Spy/CpxP family protein refolding chaperone